jgi:hypothetical protein
MPGASKDEPEAAWTEKFQVFDDYFTANTIRKFDSAVNGRALAKHRSGSILSNASFFSEASTIVDFAGQETVQPQRSPQWSTRSGAHQNHTSPSGKSEQHSVAPAAFASPLKPASPRSLEYGKRLRGLADCLSKSVRVTSSSVAMVDRVTCSTGAIECKPRLQIKAMSPDAIDLPSPGSRRCWRQCVSCHGLFNRNLSEKATMATAQLVVRSRGAEMPNGLCDHCANHGGAARPPEARKAATNLLALSEDALLARIVATGLVLTSDSPTKFPRSPARPSVSIVHERRKRLTSSPPFVSLRKGS